ncbi:hypothetical protein LY90DRAFT_630252 [Neocallimastix californiae]|uniref:Uncharacterized protein n=1 Tax=Neocallimastix californiae TaxID=1754190 RepID=A0A1Y2F0C7_9FUNG|nr:hypothetical protein LY90DRAFT_630252 [Neocallimastix californiae]|eukprot:ORY76425.1 hypothetical protein LY90DRAFT_630252 [Neocallimastix californiae]
MSKEDVLKIKDEKYTSFYCKNDICVKTDPLYDDKTVEIPDEHGNVTTYIVDTCNIQAAQNNDCPSMECNTDSDCLSNKCVNKHCVFNNKEPMIHCEDIQGPDFLFIKGELYMHCGKAWGIFVVVMMNVLLNDVMMVVYPTQMNIITPGSTELVMGLYLVLFLHVY